jgi:hypothetical protein
MRSPGGETSGRTAQVVCFGRESFPCPAERRMRAGQGAAWGLALQLHELQGPHTGLLEEEGRQQRVVRDGLVSPHRSVLARALRRLFLAILLRQPQRTMLCVRRSLREASPLQRQRGARTPRALALKTCRPCPISRPMVVSCEYEM